VLVPFAAAHAWRTRSEPSARFALCWFAVQFALIMASTNQRVRYLLSIYPGLALLVAWWAADERSSKTHRRAVVGGAVVVVAGAIAGVVMGVRLPGEPAFRVAWLVPLAGVLVVLGSLAYGLWWDRVTAVMAGVAGGMAVALAASLPLYNGWVNRVSDYRSLAATVERHAAGGEVGAFVSKGEYLQIDHYLGRYLKTLGPPSEFTVYVSSPARPVVVINQENWERHRSRMPPDLRVLEAPVVGGETMRLVRLGP
jgi:hypothetical protein